VLIVACIILPGQKLEYLCGATMQFKVPMQQEVLCMWDEELRSKEFTVVTDHLNLKYFAKM
jgi:hypothetical protein